MGKALHLFDMDIGSRINKVLKSDHNYERRGHSSFVRDEFFNNERYKNIITLAFRHGLSSYRDKGPIAITFMDYKNTTYAVLVKISQDAVFIITVYSNNRLNGYQYHFKKERNRINLWNHYRLPHMDKADRRKKEKEMIDHQSEDDDALFDSIMRSVQRI